MNDRVNGFFKQGTRTTSMRPEGYPFGGGGAAQVIPDREHEVLLLKIASLENKIDQLGDIIQALHSERFPKYVGTTEACKILGISRSLMMQRLKAGVYPFAFKDCGGNWRFNLSDLYRFQNQD